MLSTKNYNNNSSLTCNTANFNKIEVEEAIINNYYDKSYIDTTLANYSNTGYDVYKIKYDISSSYTTFSFVNSKTFGIKTHLFSQCLGFFLLIKDIF